MVQEQVLLGDARVKFGRIDALGRQCGHERRIEQVRTRDQVDEAAQAEEVDGAGDPEGVIPRKADRLEQPAHLALGDVGFDLKPDRRAFT